MKRRKYIEDEMEMAEFASMAQAASKPKNTLPNLNPPGAMLTPDKVDYPFAFTSVYQIYCDLVVHF